MNARIVTFVIVALVLLGYPAWIIVSEKVSGGIRDHGDYLEVNLKAMSTFEFDQISGQQTDVPQKWRDLDGKKVMLEGEMWAPNHASEYIPDFELVYSVAKCCFSGPPKIQHFVLAKNKQGKLMPNYSNTGLIRVTGTLNVNVEHEAGKVSRIYSLDVEKIEKL